MTTTHRYKAAVIIPSRGGADILHYPLDALAAQTEKDFQVIVVLDGDIDNSEAVLDRYIAEGKLNLTKIVFEENRGRGGARDARPPVRLMRMSSSVAMTILSRHPTTSRRRSACTVITTV